MQFKSLAISSDDQRNLRTHAANQVDKKLSGQLSPYFIPEKIDVAFDSIQDKLKIQFKYFNNEPAKKSEDIDSQVSVLLGKETNKLVSIVINHFTKSCLSIQDVCTIIKDQFQINNLEVVQYLMSQKPIRLSATPEPLA
jgi:hypothetical protein